MTDQSESSRDSISIAVAILAAGHGTRMKSDTPKHVHPVGGVPIVKRIIQAAQAIRPDHIAVVVSPSMMHLPEFLDMPGEFQPVPMEIPTGTAHAVLVALEALPEVDYIVSLLGDSPLLTGEIVANLVDSAIESGNLVTVLSCVLEDGETYGRIARDQQGRVTEIIEKKNDLHRPEGPIEINSGIMVLQRDWALNAIRRLPMDERTGEYLLTDLVKMASSEASDSSNWPVDTVQGPREVSLGINTREQQAEADDEVRKQVRKKHLNAGVTMIGAETIFIDESVEIGDDTTLHPGTILMGATKIGTGCVIGPYTVLQDTLVADNVTIRQSSIENSTVNAGADVGPYSHIRGGSVVGDNVHIGNFVELKNTTLEPGAKSGHFSYLGDAHIGERTNIGAGTITANYDGKNKNHTEIGNDVFIGSDSILVAPLTVESDSVTGAGSVVTKDVKSGDTVVGVPARPIKSKRSTSEE